MLKHSEIPRVSIPQDDKGRGAHLEAEFSPGSERDTLMTKTILLTSNDEKTAKCKMEPSWAMAILISTL